MQAALDIANSGHEVVLVDRLPSVGGHMHQLSETFPTLDCAQCIMTPRTVEVGRHKNIQLYVYSEVEEIQGRDGRLPGAHPPQARLREVGRVHGVRRLHRGLPPANPGRL